jgi:hypothetical protein
MMLFLTKENNTDLNALECSSSVPATCIHHILLSVSFTEKICFFVSTRLAGCTGTNRIIFVFIGRSLVLFSMLKCDHRTPCPLKVHLFLSMH